MNSTISASSNMRHTTSPTLESIGQTIPGRILLAICASAFVAVCAHVTLPLPFTPVPLTLSDFAVLLVGMALGPAAGFSAMVLYLAEGASGLPVFSPQGPGGVLQLLGPTAGYLFAYPLAAAVAGLAGSYRRSTMRPFTAAVITGTLAMIIILGMGAGWLSHNRFLNFNSTWEVAVGPFLFGSLAKIVAAASVFGATRRWLRS